MSLAPNPKRPPAYEALAGRAQPFTIGSVRQQMVITSRLGGDLALDYGFEDLKAFCADIPPNASILDAGAGASTLGLDVCLERPDVSWLSADICYEDEAVRKSLAADAPPNLRFLAADVFNLEEDTGGQKFDKVVSNALLFNIRLAGRKPVLAASRQLLRAAELSGQITISPVNERFKGKNNPAANSITVAAPGSVQELERSARLLAKASTMPFETRFTQSLINRSSRRIPL